VTVVYPSPGKFDNIKATLTLTANKVRVSTDTSAGYAENPPGSDARFVYNYAAVPQKVALGNAQDDPGLFLTAINNNLGDQRYLPFENAGAISSWHFEMQQKNNEINLAGVTDVVLHLYYTALDGGGALQAAASA
jgi:Tc toxin complex TcA C-terminal TcB-binding domain